MRIAILLCLLIGVIFWQNGSSIPILSGSFDGLDARRYAPETPQQTPVKTSKTKIVNGHKLSLHSHFSIQALVLSKKNYSMDKESKISPVDLALGWGPMSNPAPLDLIKITQSNRFYYFRYYNTPPIAHRQIELNSANMHIIPANDDIHKALNKVKKGNVIQMQGYLVDATTANGWNWKSSRTRADTGKGACELFYVESLKIL